MSELFPTCWVDFLGNEAGKDLGGMDGLFDLLGGLMQSAPAQKESPQQETSGAKGPDAADFEQILHIVSSCRTMIRISGCCERFSRISLRNGLPGQRMSSRSCGWQTYCRCYVFPAARKKKQPTKRSDDHGSLEQRRAFPGGISPHAGKMPYASCRNWPESSRP